MALFGKKKVEKENTPAVKKVAKVGAVSLVDTASVIVKPRITEKAALLSEKNVYTFEVRKGATKYDVREAVKSIYNVTPEKIHIVNKKPRHFTSRARGRNVMVSGLRKAYVYLKKGDRIELV